MINLVEKFLLGKNQYQELCEDGIFINNNFVAVIDGVTSKSSQRYEGKTSGRYARDILIKTLEDMPSHWDCITALKYLNSKLPKTDNISEDRIQAGIILYSNFKKEIWSYGDCICIIDNVLHQLKGGLEEEIIQHRINFLKEELKKGKTIKDLLDNCHEIVLSSDGYPISKNTLSESEKILEEIKAKDPLCMDLFKASKGFYPGKNSFDDRAYVRFTIR